MPIIEIKQKVWVPELPDIELPSEDGEPLESKWHHLQIHLLEDSLHQHWPDPTTYFVGGNMFVYYSFAQARNRDYKGPDFFVVKGVDGSQIRPSWIVWQEGGRYPDLIIELLSPITAAEDLGSKKDLYEQIFKTFEYFCVDPSDHSLQGWQLAQGQYVPKPKDQRGWLWSDSLQVWLGFWEGVFQGTPDTWLRLINANGALVLTGAERAEAERHSAEAERQRAEAERQRAEAEQQRAEAEQQRAEAEQQRAETERQNAEAERQRAETAESEVARLKAELERLRASADDT
ncbi:Uma2 family endonuclease [Candidatus Entotheonella palauensis]|uniref:Uma2 family endonuclease n=1 Tax=Candidatus Entotheonella palauensis TaxID=93172 RepID=UPI000B7FBE15|nr:Uma2 family endonuclease [Candidatus Entotheonella palauensis]